jgi:nitroimidazol reductase NimA-like FMN-containing flavoprotein (pyridoxamine 5'-phosphate oxidase superfamily)
MLIREMTEAECRHLLERAHFGRLACAQDNQPYVVPIYFAYDGQFIYGFSTPGQKIEWMRSNPLICLEMEERMERDQWTSVVVFGRYQELPDRPEFAAHRVRAHEALQKQATWWAYAAIPGAEWQRKQAPFTPIFYRIHITKLTGHRATPTASS